MQVGDLVKLGTVGGHMLADLRGIVVATERDPASGILVTVFGQMGIEQKSSQEIWR